MNGQERISCVIPVYKPSEKFYRLVKMLLLQDVPPCEIIIMNTEAEEHTCENLKQRLAQRIRGIRPDIGFTKINIFRVKPEEFDHGGTRRLAAQQCRGEYMLFMTQDAVPCDTRLTKRLLDSFGKNEEEDEHVCRKPAVVYARQVPSEDAGEKEKYARSFNYPEKGRVQSIDCLDEYGIKTYFCSNVCAMYRRDIYEALGGFVEKTIFNEDMIYAKKAVENGYSVIYNDKAEVVHSHNYGYIEQLKRSFDIAVSQKQYREVFESVSSENEGIRYLRGAIDYFLGKGRLLAAADVILDSTFRYSGYLLGKHYDILPGDIVFMLSMNKRYWVNKAAG